MYSTRLNIGSLLQITDAERLFFNLAGFGIFFLDTTTGLIQQLDRERFKFLFLKSKHLLFLGMGYTADNIRPSVDFFSDRANFVRIRVKYHFLACDKRLFFTPWVITYSAKHIFNTDFNAPKIASEPKLNSLLYQGTKLADEVFLKYKCNIENL